MKKIIFRRIALISAVALLVILIGFQLLPLTYNEPGLLSQTDLQATRAQRMVKDALVLAYRPTSEHAQAVSELQNTLPAWEAQQIYLLHTFRNPDMQALMNQAQPDYMALDTAVKKLLNTPTDHLQVEIIVDHERNYSLLMFQISNLLQSRLQSFNISLVIIQATITTLITTATVALFVLSRTQKKEKV